MFRFNGKVISDAILFFYTSAISKLFLGNHMWCRINKHKTWEASNQFYSYLSDVQAEQQAIKISVYLSFTQTQMMCDARLCPKGINCDRTWLTLVVYCYISHNHRTLYANVKIEQPVYFWMSVLKRGSNRWCTYNLGPNRFVEDHP